MSSPKLVHKFKVLQSQYDYIQDLTKNLDDANRRLFCHILACTFLQSRNHPDGYIPIPRTFLREAFKGQDITTQTLVDSELVTRKGYNKQAGLAFELRVMPEIMDRFEELGNITLSVEAAKDFIKAPKVNLLDKKPLVEPTPSETKDPNKHPHPKLIVEAIECLREDYFNLPAILAHLEQLKQAYFEEPDRKKQIRLRRRYKNDYKCYDSLLKQNPEETEKPGIFRYTPAYKVQSTGRISAIGGCLQSCTRKMKVAAYSNTGLDIKNYDISATQAHILLNELSRAGLDKAWLWKYLNDKKFKYQKAEEAGLHYDVWKTCFYAVVMGATLPGETYRWNKGEISKIFLEEFPVREERQAAYAKFYTVIKPLWNTIQEWHSYQLVLDISSQGLPKIKPKYFLNPVGMKFHFSDYPDYRKFDPKTNKPTKEARKAQGKIAAHILQGTEALFIHTLTTIAHKYGFQPLSNQHDGLVVIGKISNEAIEEAKALTGFSYLDISEKGFL